MRERRCRSTARLCHPKRPRIDCCGTLSRRKAEETHEHLLCDFLCLSVVEPKPAAEFPEVFASPDVAERDLPPPSGIAQADGRWYLHGIHNDKTRWRNGTPTRACRSMRENFVVVGGSTD
jgi:hypothetical protein